MRPGRNFVDEMRGIILQHFSKLRRWRQGRFDGQKTIIPSVYQPTSDWKAYLRNLCCKHASLDYLKLLFNNGNLLVHSANGALVGALALTEFHFCVHGSCSKYAMLQLYGQVVGCEQYMIYWRWQYMIDWYYSKPMVTKKKQKEIEKRFAKNGVQTFISREWTVATQGKCFL